MTGMHAPDVSNSLLAGLQAQKQDTLSELHDRKDYNFGLAAM
jgi:hypothetical protein